MFITATTVNSLCMGSPKQRSADWCDCVEKQKVTWHVDCCGAKLSLLPAYWPVKIVASWGEFPRSLPVQLQVFSWNSFFSWTPMQMVPFTSSFIFRSIIRYKVKIKDKVQRHFRLFLINRQRHTECHDVIPKGNPRESPPWNLDL